MILVTVGTQFAFDRMVKVVDDWAVAQDRDDVTAQIGPTDYVPSRIGSFAFSNPAELRALQEECSLMVAHAGMGSIVTALELGKPIIVMPRELARGEHRNDHQMATARRFRDVPGVHVADDEAALRALLDRIDELLVQPSAGRASPVAPDDFLDALRAHLSGVFPDR